MKGATAVERRGFYPKGFSLVQPLQVLLCQALPETRQTLQAPHSYAPFCYIFISASLLFVMTCTLDFLVPKPLFIPHNKVEMLSVCCSSHAFHSLDSLSKRPHTSLCPSASNGLVWLDETSQCLILTKISFIHTSLIVYSLAALFGSFAGVSPTFLMVNLGLCPLREFNLGI